MEVMEDKKCDKCNSTEINFVKYETANGIKILRKQCSVCGRLLVKGYKRTLIKDFDLLPDYNKYTREKYREKAIEKREINSIFFNFSQEHFNRSYSYYHNIYLKSNEWKTKRDLVMKFYNYKCSDCGEVAKDVHHITYERIFKEKFEDLLPLCRSCHSKKHGYEFKT